MFTPSLSGLALFVSLLSFQFCSVGALYVREPGANADDIQKRAVAYYNPLVGGGSMLTDTGNGLGEPLNVIISGLSSSDVLTDDGFLNFARSLGFSGECLDIHLGDPQTANLGDGNSWKEQTTELRKDYGNSKVGTCLESLLGGNHLRIFRQNGASANSGALFLAMSQEENVLKHHTISQDGYNLGRDALVSAATSSHTSFDGITYSSTSQDISALLTAGSAGINHDIAIDGIVKLLTVKIV